MEAAEGMRLVTVAVPDTDACETTVRKYASDLKAFPNGLMIFPRPGGVTDGEIPYVSAQVVALLKAFEAAAGVRAIAVLTGKERTAVH